MAGRLKSKPRFFSDCGFAVAIRTTTNRKRTSALCFLRAAPKNSTRRHHKTKPQPPQPQRQRTQSHQPDAANMSVLDEIKADLAAMIKEKGCGPIMIRLSWHDAGVYSTGKLTGGCPNAVMRFAGEGEGAFSANVGLPTVAIPLLKPISDKYCPDQISHADLWALAANVAIEVMGGPVIPTRFGRVDAKDASESVESQVGRLPDADKGVEHLRDIFGPKGFDDKDIVALSGAHTVGGCHLDRSGFDGKWTETPLAFDNTYFTDLLTKKYEEEKTEKGNTQRRHKESGTMMLISDMALLEAPFRQTVELYAKNQQEFFADFAKAWVKLQENGCENLRDTL